MTSLHRFRGNYTDDRETFVLSVFDKRDFVEVLMVLLPTTLVRDLPPSLILRYQCSAEDWRRESLSDLSYRVVRSGVNGYRQPVLQEVAFFPPKFTHDWIVTVKEFTIERDYFYGIPPTDGSKLLVKYELTFNPLCPYVKVQSFLFIQFVSH